ncbi:hypothetical protein D3C72_2121610 [compost metagenome]
MVRVRPGRSGVKNHFDFAEIGQREQAINAFRRRRHAQPIRTGQAVGGRIDSDHRSHFQVLTVAQDLDHQIGADVARTDDCSGNLR